jgi:uncharacterized membrane protein (Fun14 family)
LKALSFSQIILQATSVSSTLFQLFGPPAAELGFSGILGYAVGYFLKKILKLIIITLGALMGLELGFLYWLQSIGAINVTVNYEKLSSIGTNAITWGTTQLGSLVAFASTISFISTGFIGGAIIGFSRA